MATFPTTYPLPRHRLTRLREHPLAPAALAVALSLGALGVLAVVGAIGLLALMIGLAVVLLVLAEPRWGLYLAVLSVPVQQYGSVRGLTFTQAAFLLVLGAWLVGQAVRGADWPMLRDANFWRFALFYGVILASARVAADVRPTLAEGWRWGEALAVYAIARATLRTRRDWGWLVAVCCLAASGEAFIGSVQSKLHLGNVSFAFSADYSRAFGTFGRPNSYAGYLEMIFPLAVAATLWAITLLPGRVRRWRVALGGPLVMERRALGALFVALSAVIALLAAALMLLAGIALSFSRGAWLGVAAGLLTMTFLAGRRPALITLAITLVFALALVVTGGSILPAPIQERVGSVGSSLVLTNYDRVPITDKNFAVKERMAYWFGGLNMIHDYPWTGVGLGNYGAQYDAKYYTSPFMKSQVHAHNYYIHVTAETGIVGLAAYLLLIGGVIATGVSAARRARHDGFARTLAIGGVGVVVAVAAHNFFEDLHVLSLGIQLSATWALLAAIRAAHPPLDTHYSAT